MGGGEKAKANQMADQQYAQESQASKTFADQQSAERVGARERADATYDALNTGYRNLGQEKLTLDSLGGPITGGGGVSAPQYTRDAGFATAGNDYRNFATTGGIDADAMRKGEGTMQDFMATGGVDPARKASIESNIAGLQTMGKTGGVTDADMARMQGNGGFDEFAKTGGLSDADRANIRSRATSVIPSTMATANATADRMRSVQGGYGPGTAALKSRLLRSANTDNAAAARDAELGITQQVNAGRQYGISGMADSSLKANTLKTGNQLSGLNGAASADSDYAKILQSGKEWGADSISGVENNIQGLTQAGKEFGTTGTMNLAQSNQDFSDRQQQAAASAANANAGTDRSNQLANIDLQKYIAGYNRDSEMAGLGGLSSLYGSTPAEVAMYDQNNLANRGMSNASQNSTTASKLANNKSAMDNVTGIVGAVASAAGGIGGGLGALVPKPKITTG